MFRRSDPEQVILNTTEVIRPGVDENRRVEHLYQVFGGKGELWFTPFSSYLL